MKNGILTKKEINIADKIFVIGASGSGKTTLANKISNDKKITHLDLDDYFWEEKYTKKSSLEDRTKKLNIFLKNNNNRVIEGIFVEWIEEIYTKADLVIILNIPNHKIALRHLKRFVSNKIKRKKEENFKSAFNLAKWAMGYQNKNKKHSIYRHIEDCKKYGCKYIVLNK